MVFMALSSLISFKLNCSVIEGSLNLNLTRLWAQLSISTFNRPID